MKERIAWAMLAVFAASGGFVAGQALHPATYQLIHIAEGNMARLNLSTGEIVVIDKENGLYRLRDPQAEARLWEKSRLP